MPWVLLSTVCYFSLQFANPEGAEKLITEVEEKISNLKKSGTLPAGLAEQYDIQLAALRDPNIPDIEIIPNSGLAFGMYTPSPTAQFLIDPHIQAIMTLLGTIPPWDLS